MQRGGTAVCAQLTLQKQGTENGPPENRSIASSARLRARKEKSRITQFCEKTGRKKMKPSHGSLASSANPTLRGEPQTNMENSEKTMKNE